MITTIDVHQWPSRVLGVLGELLLTAGVLVLLYAVYLLWGTALETQQAQGNLREQIERQRSAPAAAVAVQEPKLGEPYGVLTIRRFGRDWDWVVIEGARQRDLAKGPGHYPNTAGPGELGNLAIAGHRSGHGEPFAAFDRLEVGDVVRLRTSAGEWTYRIDVAPRRIRPREAWVIDPVPGAGPGVAATERRLTLTTCWPRYGSSHRLYASAVLVEGQER